MFWPIRATRPTESLSGTHAVARRRSSLPVASDLLFQSERLVPQIVLLFSQAADETRQLSVLPEQPLRQGAGGASRQQGNALRTDERCSTERFTAKLAGFSINGSRRFFVGQLPNDSSD